MEYRPKPKKRSPFVSFILFILLLAMTAVLVFLLAVYTGYIEFQAPVLTEQFAPPPTPTRPAVLYISDGDALFAEGKLQQAVDAYEQAIHTDPTNDVPYIRQARLLIYTRDTAAALERAAQAVALNPDSPENLAYYCRSLDWEARYAEALDVCSCAIEKDPSYAEGYAFLAEVYADLGNWRLAEANARQAIEANFQSMDAHHNMGYALEVQGRYAEAVEFYENAIKLAPNLAPLYLAAGRVYQIGLADYDSAIERFKKAIKLTPFDPEPYDLLGWAYYFNGEDVRAVDAFEQSINLDPNYVNPFRRASAWGHMATMYYTRQNFEKAIEFLPKAIQLGESEFLRRTRQLEVVTQVETLTGPKSIPVLRGRFIAGADNASSTAQLSPVNYLAEVDFDTEQSCSDLIKQSIQTDTILLGSTAALEFTKVFSRATGTATLNYATGALFLDLQNLPPSQTAPYEIKVTFWPNRTDSVGYFQANDNHQAQVNIQFEEKLSAPIEYYYELGLAYAYLDPPQCDKAVPWLLRSLEIDGSAFNPAWAGLRICPSPNAPPTPVPTATPTPEAE